MLGAKASCVKVPATQEKRRKKGAQSHFQFKNWTWDDDGKRSRPVVVRPLKRECADLVNTCYHNPASGTKTLYTIVWDLDAHRAEDQWKTKDGKLKWNLIRNFLVESYPDLVKYIFAAVQSTSGKGIALALAISPMELIEGTQTAQNAARALQHKILHLLNHSGLGADPGALGLERDFPNWHDNNRLLYSNQMLLSAVQARYERRPIVTELLQYLKQFPFLSYQRKRGCEDLLYHDIRAEVKLAKFYMHALNDWSWKENTASAQLSTKEIREITGLSKPFLLKFLSTPPSWLETEWMGKAEGWRLYIKFDRKLTCRADDLMDRIPKHPSDSKSFSEPLKRPSEVEDGERNGWLTQALLLLKHHGVEQDRARELIKGHIPLIPGFEWSRNCKEVEQIIRSIYRGKPHLFGIKPGCAPVWLLVSDFPKASVVPLCNKASEEKKTISKKGALAPGGLLRLVSFDGCFSFRGNFYSVPEVFLGLKVRVFEWGKRLRVFDAEGKRFVLNHTLVDGRGNYIVIDAHTRDFGEREDKYFEYILNRFSFGSGHAERMARRLVERHGLFAVRRLWVLAGLVKVHGLSEVDRVCASAWSLSEILTCLGVKKIRARF